MKKVLHAVASLFAALTLSLNVSAQLPNGSIAPNWTLTDLDGNEHTLYEYLDNGYTVFIDFSATWCGPCWNYHNSGALEDLYIEHGPAGMANVDANTTDDVMVFFIEGDPTTTIGNLNGLNDGDYPTQGDWVAGTPYPIINDDEVAFDYQIGYWPTIYKVCPNRIIVEAGQENTANQYASINDCEMASQPTDASALFYTGDVVTCEDAEIRVVIQNMGLTPLTSATIEVTGDVSLSYNWSGDLGTYDFVEIVAGTVAITDVSNIEVNVVAAGDANAANNGVDATISPATDATTHIRLTLATDNWPEENTWEITDENGAVVASGGPYTGQALTTITENRWVPSTGCYTFTFFDLYGDGLHGSQWGSIDGNFTVAAIAGDGTVYSTIGTYNGSYDFSIATAGFESSTVVGIEEAAVLFSGVKIYPNPANDVTTVSYGVAEASKVSLTVYNMLGEVIVAEDFGTQSAGMYNYVLDLGSENAGIYFVNLTANDRVITKKVTLTK
jgi:thiol-disulfide isomerase/thioredoxin